MKKDSDNTRVKLIESQVNIIEKALTHWLDIEGVTEDSSEYILNIVTLKTLFQIRTFIVKPIYTFNLNKDELQMIHNIVAEECLQFGADFDNSMSSCIAINSFLCNYKNGTTGLIYDTYSNWSEIKGNLKSQLT